jgi:hypothetical protein
MNANRIPPVVLAGWLIGLLAAFSFIPWVSANPRLAGSIWAAAGALALFLLFVRYRAARSGRVLSYTVVPRPVHYVQLTMHTSIYLYWGWYWRGVYHYAPLIVAQIVFVYAFDMLLCWSRRDKWILGFGPFPIVLSTNLFLWFRDDWFYLQFLLIATAVLCKEFVTWQRDGRRTHIFNPSAIALAIFSIGLIVTHNTILTWGEEVAVSQGRPPHIYLEIFALGLVVQALFSVTLVTLSAAAALLILNLAYTGATGLYYFVDSTIPIAVFLGLHLLVTDPATSPRRASGKVIFGAMYGALVFWLYDLLGRMGAPTFYDKLLCVPPLNLLAPPLDRLGATIEARLPHLTWSPRQLNLAHMSVWAALCSFMFAGGFIGGRHPGSDPEFWRTACESRKGNACEVWAHTLNVTCQHGSGLACSRWEWCSTRARSWRATAPSRARTSRAPAISVCSTHARAWSRWSGRMAPMYSVRRAIAVMVRAASCWRRSTTAAAACQGIAPAQSRSSEDRVTADGRAAAAAWRNATVRGRESLQTRSRPRCISNRPAEAECRPVASRWRPCIAAIRTKPARASDSNKPAI